MLLPAILIKCTPIPKSNLAQHQSLLWLWETSPSSICRVYSWRRMLAIYPRIDLHHLPQSPRASPAKSVKLRKGTHLKQNTFTSWSKRRILFNKPFQRIFSSNKVLSLISKFRLAYFICKITSTSFEKVILYTPFGEIWIETCSCNSFISIDSTTILACKSSNIGDLQPRFICKSNTLTNRSSGSYASAWSLAYHSAAASYASNASSGLNNSVSASYNSARLNW